MLENLQWPHQWRLEVATKWMWEQWLKEVEDQKGKSERRRPKDIWQMGARELFRSVLRMENEDNFMEY